MGSSAARPQQYQNQLSSQAHQFGPVSMQSMQTAALRSAPPSGPPMAPTYPLGGQRPGAAQARQQSNLLNANFAAQQAQDTPRWDQGRFKESLMNAGNPGHYTGLDPLGAFGKSTAKFGKFDPFGIFGGSAPAYKKMDDGSYWFNGAKGGKKYYGGMIDPKTGSVIMSQKEDPDGSKAAMLTQYLRTGQGDLGKQGKRFVKAVDALKKSGWSWNPDSQMQPGIVPPPLRMNPSMPSAVRPQQSPGIQQVMAQMLRSRR